MTEARTADLIEQTIDELGRAVDTVLNGAAHHPKPAWGFCLIVFPFHTGNRANLAHISNADRESLATALRELADRLGQSEGEAGHA